MYAIEQNGAWVKVSSSHAAFVCTQANGAPVSVPAMQRLPSATLANWGVRKLQPGVKPTLLAYQYAVPDSIQTTGDEAVQIWTSADQTLDTAKAVATEEVINTAREKRAERVIVTVGPNDYGFEMDEDSIHKYTMIGAALASGVTYPAGGIPFRVYVNDNPEKLRLTDAQWTIAAEAMATKAVAIANREDALDSSVETAVDLTELRGIDINTGWPT